MAWHHFSIAAQGRVPSRFFPELGIHLLIGRVLGQARRLACVRRRREVLTEQQRKSISNL